PAGIRSTPPWPPAHLRLWVRARYLRLRRSLISSLGLGDGNLPARRFRPVDSGSGGFSASIRHSASETTGRSRRARRHREPSFVSGPLPSLGGPASCVSGAASGSIRELSSEPFSESPPGGSAGSLALYFTARTAATRSS